MNKEYIKYTKLRSILKKYNKNKIKIVSAEAAHSHKNCELYVLSECKGDCYNTPLVTREGGTKTSCGCLEPVLVVGRLHEAGDDRTTAGGSWESYSGGCREDVPITGKGWQGADEVRCQVTTEA